jgi:ABC-type sugar transport system ATPase subunit
MSAVPGTPGPLLSLRGVTKRYGGVMALAGVDFDLRAGEIHALLGENGAGKSTLIKVLGGVERADAGAIAIDGHPVEIRDTAGADRLGIRLIHQELALAPNLSVAENILLGREMTRLGMLIDRRRLDAAAEALIAELDMPEIGSVRALVGGLSIAQRQLVEIARVLAVRARILVLDEPTASLSQHEAETLMARLRRLREQGVGIIYISHRLEEIRRLADRITVLRDGRNVGTRDARGGNPDELVRLMVGRDVATTPQRPDWKPGPVILAVEDLHNDRVHGVTFELRAGEVLGLAGLVGSGRSALARALCGLDGIRSGRIRVDGRPIAPRSPGEARAAGIVLVPEDRKGQGLVMTGSLAYNLALPWTRDWIRGVRVDRRRRAAIVERAIGRFGIKADHPDQSVGSLSGGNQQKVVVARWMEHPPRVLILDEPTRGVDVKARSEMYAILRDLVVQGIAVLLISSDLPEVIGLSHRLVLYRDGRILREIEAHRADPVEVMASLVRFS